MSVNGLLHGVTEQGLYRLTFQRFPQFMHSQNVVIGSSALRVCACV